jgi:hypothetical protein
MDAFVCASNLNDLQRQYDEILAEKSRWIHLYDSSADGSEQKKLALHWLGILNAQLMQVEREFCKHF